jgi:hypothetical protein
VIENDPFTVSEGVTAGARKVGETSRGVSQLILNSTLNRIK